MLNLAVVILTYFHYKEYNIKYIIWRLTTLDMLKRLIFTSSEDEGGPIANSRCIKL